MGNSIRFKWNVCEECGKQTRRQWIYENRLSLCYCCYIKKKERMPWICFLGEKREPIELPAIRKGKQIFHMELGE